jgi:hypothetical protein
VTEVYLDNPAGRLHRILVRMKQSHGNVPVMHGMAEVLGIVPAFLPDVSLAVSQVFSLAVETQSEIQSLSEDHPKELLLRWQPRVMEALNAIFFQNITPPPTLSAIAGRYGDDDLLALAFCSAALHQVRRELVIEQTALALIREQIADLLAVLESDADLDGELRVLLLRNVRAMLWACDRYDLCGTAGIRDAVNQTVGALVNNPALVARRESSPNIWQKVTTVIAAVTATVGLATAVVTAVEKASPATYPEIVIVQDRELPPGTGSANPPSPLTHAGAGHG